MESWFHGRGVALCCVPLYEPGQRLPRIEDFDWLVILGGGMSVNDEATLPWLVPEKALVREAIAARKLVLGICLGAQMIASALGAQVYRNPVKEIGWWPITREAGAVGHPLAAVLPARCEVFHWHGETFDLPAGALHLARSEACLNQAFAVGDRVLGLQFHLETTEVAAQALVDGCPDDLTPGPFVQPAEVLLARPGRFAVLNELMVAVLERLALQAGSAA